MHDQSSRSHAILRIYIQRHDLRSTEPSSVPGGKPPVVEGTLTLVDLAGSEHRIDSMYVHVVTDGVYVLQYLLVV